MLTARMDGSDCCCWVTVVSSALTFIGLLGSLGPLWGTVDGGCLHGIPLKTMNNDNPSRV